MQIPETEAPKLPKRHWRAEQKLQILEEWRSGLPLEEICRKYAVRASAVYQWRKELDRGLKNSGSMVPKADLISLERKVEELERALGRKALEVDILKKTFESKGLKFPEGI
jgi:transposase-like protein